jgi:hypothetical protein
MEKNVWERASILLVSGTCHAGFPGTGSFGNNEKGHSMGIGQ